MAPAPSSERRVRHREGDRRTSVGVGYDNASRHGSRQGSRQRAAHGRLPAGSCCRGTRDSPRRPGRGTWRSSSRSPRSWRPPTPTTWPPWSVRRAHRARGGRPGDRPRRGARHRRGDPAAHPAAGRRSRCGPSGGSPGSARARMGPGAGGGRAVRADRARRAARRWWAWPGTRSAAGSSWFGRAHGWAADAVTGVRGGGRRRRRGPGSRPSPTRSCSGRCAAAGATSRSSPRWSSSCDPAPGPVRRAGGVAARRGRPRSPAAYLEITARAPPALTAGSAG